MTYTQRTPNSCGPDALQFASGATFDAIDQAFECPDITRFRDSMDSPLDHRFACGALGLPITVMGIDAILACRGDVKIVALVHGAGLAGAFLHQHWCVIVEVTDQTVCVAWGDGTIKVFKHAAFKDAFKRAAPEFAYRVGAGEVPHLRWWERALRWLGRKIGY